MTIGYPRVSTRYRSAQLQRIALEEADCEQVFVKRVTRSPQSVATRPKAEMPPKAAGTLIGVLLGMEQYFV